MIDNHLLLSRMTIPNASSGTIASKPASNGLKTVVKFQRVLAQRYFDAAGFPGRTVGLTPKAANRKRRGNDPALRISTDED
jgi:hypothetical protein